MEKIIGIDLGTTNSEVAIVIDGKPQLIADGKQRLIPSVVGLSPDGELMVGQAAKNQYVLYPDRTVKSIKRKMGSDFKARLGDKEYTPSEISAFILKKLKTIAENFLGESLQKAVITVPAYFNEAQRQATKDAGEIAGLEVVRIINEPTAAALAYGVDREQNQTVAVYDLGGGTFDVSLVEINSGVTEVKSSHGNNQLGGDDFDQKIVDFLVENFKQTHNIDLTDNLKAMARIFKAAEKAKITLSDNPYAMIAEEFIAKKKQVPQHLKYELSRDQFNDMIEKLIQSTGDSIELALTDAELLPKDIDKVLLVGGSTRIPLVYNFIEDRLSKQPHSEINPDECVALGAAIQGAIIAGEAVDAVLVDVTPYSLGVEVVEFKLGEIIPDRYNILIRRNTVIPVSKSDAYYTLFPDQKSVKVKVYQGENKTASENVLLGDFTFENIPTSKDGSDTEFVVKFDLDIDGILHVSATHKDTGRQEAITVKASRERLSEEEKESSREKITSLKLAEESEVGAVLKKAKELIKTHKDKKATNSLKELVAKIEAAGLDDQWDEVEKLHEELLDKLYELE